MAHVRGITQREAAQELHERFCSAARPATSPKPPVAEGEMQPLDYLDAEHEALSLLGLTPDVCRALGIGFASKGTMAGRIAIPLRLSNGTLIGYAGLATREDLVPLMKFPANLAEKCSEPDLPDAMRRLFRVV